MPQLVQEDEQDEAGDHDEHTSRGRQRSFRDLPRRAVGLDEVVDVADGIGAGGFASVSPTTSGIPRNGRRPARKAATATSLAAL